MPARALQSLTITSKLFRRFDFGIADPVTPIKTACHQIHIQEQMFLSVWPAK